MNFPTKKVMPRYSAIAIVLIFMGIMAFCKAFYTCVIDPAPWLKMDSLLVKEGRPLLPKRGNILSDDGQILASSLPEYEVYVDFMSSERNPAMREKDQKRRDNMLSDEVLDAACKGMHDIFPDIIPEKLKEHLRKGRELERKYWPVYTDEVTTLKLRPGKNRRISYIQYSEMNKLPFFSVRSTMNYQKVDLRKRPYGEMASHTIGDFKDGARYGLELSFDTLLAGKPGEYHLQKVMNRKITIVDRPAENGYDIVTTLDVAMQEIVEQALGDKLKEINARDGICILMETATGDIKAMSSLSRHEDGSYHEDRAMAVTDLYEPGSVFKPQSFLVAFNDGKIKMDDFVDVGNGIYNFGTRAMKDHNWRSGGYGHLTVPQIIGNSSNVGVSVLINRHYSSNPRSFVDGLYKVGSAENLHIPLPGYQKPRIRRPGEGAYWSATTLPWMSIGYETQVTPINTLNFYNGIANNGKLLQPRLVKAIMRDGEVVKEFPVKVLRQHMAKPQAVRNIQECLEYVTTLGVGKPANSRHFAVAGKTGTAQIWSSAGRTSEYFITFAGYFPADAPKYSCIVCIRKPAPASGGGMCGPVFKRVAESVMARNHQSDYTSACDTEHAGACVVLNGNMVPTSRLVESLGMNSNYNAGDKTTAEWGATDCVNNTAATRLDLSTSATVPDVKGYGLRDAVYRLESLGLRVTTKGVGRVTTQSLAPGHAVRRGERIELTLGTAHRDKHNATPRPAAPAAPAPTADSAAGKPKTPQQ